jgi:uncharacterized membrane protein YdbT with pleckstrin-like domain
MAEFAPREVVVARIHSHARALFWPSVLLVVVCAALGFFGSFFPEPWQNLAVLGAGVLIIVVGWLLPLLRWLAHNYTITTRRVVLRSGVFVRVRQELLHSRAFDVTVRRSAVQTMFGTGDVLLNLGGEGRLVLRDVPSPNLVQETLHDLIQSSGPPRPALSIG